VNLSNVFLVQLPNFSLSFSFIPVAPVITGIIVHFRFHIHCISIRKILYFNCNFIIIIIIIIIIIYLLQLKFHPVAVVLTLVQTKQIRYKIYINKTIQKKNIVATIQNTVNKSTNTSKYKYTYHYKCLYSTHYSKHPQNCQNTHTLQNKLKQPQYKTHTHTKFYPIQCVLGLCCRSVKLTIHVHLVASLTMSITISPPSNAYMFKKG